MPTNTKNFLDIIRGNMSQASDQVVVKVNYRALGKLLEEHENLSNQLKKVRKNEGLTPEEENVESFGYEMMTVNFKALAELVGEYEKLLESLKNHKKSK